MSFIERATYSLAKSMILAQVRRLLLGETQDLIVGMLRKGEDPVPTIASRFDPDAVGKLAPYIRQNAIRVIPELQDDLVIDVIRVLATDPAYAEIYPLAIGRWESIIDRALNLFVLRLQSYERGSQKNRSSSL